MRQHLVDASFLYNNMLLAEWAEHGSVPVEVCRTLQLAVENIERNSLEALKMPSAES